MCIQTAGEGTRPHALRRTTSLENALTNHVDVDTSSSEVGVTCSWLTVCVIALICIELLILNSYRSEWSIVFFEKGIAY